MRFLVDHNLGSLTKWLRFLGFDVAQIRLSLQEAKTLPPPQRDTIFLTRQTSLPKALQRPDLDDPDVGRSDGPANRNLPAPAPGPGRLGAFKALQRVQCHSGTDPPGTGGGPGSGFYQPEPAAVFRVSQMPAGILGRQPPGPHQTAIAKVAGRYPGALTAGVFRKDASHGQAR